MRIAPRIHPRWEVILIHFARSTGLAVAILGLALIPAASRAQVFGQFTTAETVAPGGHQFGAYLHANDSVLGVLGQLRMSFYPGVDFGFQGGVSKLNLSGGDRTLVRFGTDLKARVVQAGEQLPFGVGVGAGIGVETSDDYSVLTIAPSGVASRGYLLGGTVRTMPYAGLALAFTRSSIGSRDESDLSIPLRLGSEVELANATRFVFELELFFGRDFGDDYQIAAGINAPF